MKIADNVELDLETFLGQRAIFQAAPGGGKSTGARLILEAAYGRFQELILDVDGDFHTLRTEGRDYAIIGGENGDAPLGDIERAGDLALTLLKLGVSVVLQLDDLPLGDQRKFVGKFAAGLMRAPRELWHPVLLMLDEAHYFVPEGSVEASSEAVTFYATGGRKRGFSALFATTRLSLFSKDVLGACANKFLGRVEQAADRKAAADQLGFTAKSPEALEMQAFSAGEFYCVGPALSPTPVRTRLLMPQTRVPRPGTPVLPSPTPAAIQRALAAIAKAAPAPTASEPATAVAPAASKVDLEAEYKSGFGNGYADGHIDGYADGIRDTEQRLGQKVLDFAADFALAANTLTQKATKQEGGLADTSVTTLVPLKVELPASLLHGVTVIDHLKVPTAGASKPQKVGANGLSGPQAKVLQSLAWWALIGIDNPRIAQVAVIAGWSPNSSNIRDRSTELARSGHIDRPVPGTMRLTPLGREVAPRPADSSFQESIAGVMTKPQQAVFTALLTLAEPIRVGDLATLIGWSPDSSNIRDRLTELSRLTFIKRPTPGYVALDDWVVSSLRSAKKRAAR